MGQTALRKSPTAWAICSGSRRYKIRLASRLSEIRSAFLSTDKWREIEGKQYYMPGEACDTVTKNWFYVEGDHPRSDAELLQVVEGCRRFGVNLVLDVGPDKQGLITGECRDALMRLRKNANW